MFLRHHLGTIAAALALLGLAACATPKAPPAAPAPAPAEQAARPAPKPAETVKKAPPQHQVALLAPLTGPNAPIGQSIANAANMALLDINDPRIKLTIYDTAEGPEAAASRALADGAKVVLGPLLAPDVRAVQPATKAAGVPVITFSNDAELAIQGTYVMGFQPDQEVERVVAYARQRGITRFAALVPAGSYGKRASEAFVASVKASGGQLVAIETYPRDRTKLLTAARRVAGYDARLALSRARAAKSTGVISAKSVPLPPPAFEALLIADTGDYTRAFVPALRQFGVETNRVRLLGTGLWNNEPALAREPALQGAWFATVSDATFESLAKRYAGRFGARPSRLSSLGYDGILLVHAAANGGWQIGKPFPQSVLKTPSGYAGIDGLFRFPHTGVAERGMEVDELSGGTFKVVSPAPTAFSPAIN